MSRDRWGLTSRPCDDVFTSSDVPRRLTTAFQRLRKNLGRAETLLDKFFDNPAGAPRHAGQPEAHEQEMLRSVLVLAIGALDAYLSDLLIETIPRIAKVSSAQAVFDQLAKARPGLLLRAFFVGKEQLQQELIEVLEAEFAGDSMHGSRAIVRVSDWCALELGWRDFNTDDFPEAMRVLDEWTDKRHRIVHRGELVRLRRADATNIIKLVRSIGKTLNDRVIQRYG